MCDSQHCGTPTVHIIEYIVMQFFFVKVRMSNFLSTTVQSSSYMYNVLFDVDMLH